MFLRRCSTIVFLLLLATVDIASQPQGQQDTNRTRADKLAKEAEELRQKGDGESLRKAIDKLAESIALRHSENDQAAEADALFQISAIYRLVGDNRRAKEALEKALPLQRAGGDGQSVVNTLGLIAAIDQTFRDTDKAIEHYEEALAIARRVGYRQGEARTLTRLGLLLTSIGEYERAISAQTEALSVAQALGGGLSIEEAGIFLNIGLAQRLSGDNQNALQSYWKAFTMFQALADHPPDPQKLNNIRAGQGQAMENIGVVNEELGDSEAAVQWFGNALSLYRNGGNRQQEARMLGNMGTVYLALDDHLRASGLFTDALKLAREVADRATEAEALLNLTDVSNRIGDRKQALDYTTQALSIFHGANDRRGEVRAHLRLGSIYQQLADRVSAQDHYNQALTLTRILKYSGGEARALAGLAQIERTAGKLDVAQQRMEAALSLIESIRSSVAIQDLRASYLASTQDDYEFYVDLLMQLHRLRPSEGFDALALHAAERARARSLLELLAEGHADVRRGIPSALLERERLLEQRLNASAQTYASVLGNPKTKDEAAAILKDIEVRSEELEEIEGQIRSVSPQYAGLTQPRPLRLREIQEQILDRDTLLLEYALGNERSFLWAVTKTSISTYELPPRSVIEASAHRIYDFLTARQPKGGSARPGSTRLVEIDAQLASEAAALSMTLLGPVRRDLGTKRLLVVSDGALQYVPFAALPVPHTTVENGPAIPLVAEHEIISMPSASTFGLLRQELAGRVPASKSLAVFADPVFDHSDNRVHAISTKGSPTVAVDRARTREGLARLAFSRREADEILAVAHADDAKKAIGFEANRKAVTDAQLSQYRIIHFATHGILDSKHPELSAIVLSLVNENGDPQDGYLRLHDLYNLNLPAELVVLSACQTALGKDIKGEGLIGLTRGFMYAGAARVVASLWMVDDGATAELMKEFYQAMLGPRHLSPAAALRAAQLSISKRQQWASPYYWAGFVLQGDWNGWQ